MYLAINIDWLRLGKVLIVMFDGHLASAIISSDLDQAQNKTDYVLEAQSENRH